MFPDKNTWTSMELTLVLVSLMYFLKLILNSTLKMGHLLTYLVFMALKSLDRKAQLTNWNMIMLVNLKTKRT